MIGAPSKSRALIVLGMHRSGTSLFTGLLGLLGVDLGPKLLAASSANEAGYWEHREVVTIHERLLLELGSSWDDVSRLPGEWWNSEKVAPYRTQLVELLARDFREAPLWTVKDPRTCRLLPLWKSVLEELECEAVWVLMTRHPFENIKSLEKRNGFSWEKSELLWLQHTLEAERGTRGDRRAVVTFDQLLADWNAALERVREAVGQAWPISPEQAAAQVSKFLDPGKRHHRALDAGRLSWWTGEAYEALLAGTEGNETGMRERLAPVQAGFEAADALYRPVLRGRAEELESHVAGVQANYAHLFDVYREMQAKYDASKEKMAVQGRELSVQTNELRRLERSAGGKLNRLLAPFRARVETTVPPVDFPAVEGVPEVSIIVAAGSKLARTARCLQAVREQMGGRNVEVVAVADEFAVENLRAWQNLQTVSSGKTRSFAEPHNRAAQKARGTYLVFLQDRILPGEGWLEALLETLRTRPDAGLAGPEAGILKRDGSMEMLPAAGGNELREADFCTLACCAVSKNLFFQVGGFEGYYLPVEEASFGLKIRQTRHKVWQQPRCHVTSHGPEHRFDPERFESHRQRFAQRWAEALARQPA